MKNKKVYWIISFIIIFIFISPYIFIGEGVYVSIFDNLDSEISWFKILAESGVSNSVDAPIPNIMNGVTRISYQSNLNVYRFLYFLGPFSAILINKILTILVGFFGMYIFLKKHILKQGYLIILFGVSLCFSFLPFWNSTSLGVAFLPFAFYLFNKFRIEKVQWYDWIGIIVIAFCSDFLRIYLFFIFLQMMMFIYYWIKEKKINFRYLTAIILLVLIFLLIEYRLLIFILEKPFVSHREEFINSSVGFIETIKKMLILLIKGQGHVNTVHTFIILPLGFLVILLGRKKSKLIPYLTFLLISSFIYAIYYFKPFSDLYFSDINPLKTIQLNRFYWLGSFFWYVVFAISLKYIYDLKIQVKIKKIIMFGVLLIQISLLFYSADHMKKIISPDKYLSYKEYFAVSLFTEIKKDIPEKLIDFKTLSLGISPSVPQYNKFQTLDGYMGNYPLSYKKEFRRIIKSELKKSKVLTKYFDDWGSRCYLFCSEIGTKLDNKNILKKVNNIEINTKVAKDMGCKYIFSSVIIGNSDLLNLTKIKTYSNNNLSRVIHLYRLN